MIEIIPNWHPIFVHFTVALLSVSLGLYIVAAAIGSEQLRLVAKWNLWIGSAVTLLTVAAGWYAFNTVAHDDPSHAAMTEHRNWALVTVAVLIPVLIWSVAAERKAKRLGWGFLALFVVAGGLLASTAWHGGEVVYRYGLGVISLPQTDAHDHGAHAKGAEHAHGDAGHDDGHDHEDAGRAHGMPLDADGEMDFSGMDLEAAEMDTSSSHDDGHDHSH